MLATYLSELILWNKRTGLVEARDTATLIEHIEDCAAGVPVFQEVLRRKEAAGMAAAQTETARELQQMGGDGAASGADAGPAGGDSSGITHNPRPRILDLGSGAGLPGLVLAILLPGADLVLVEKSERRTAFLRACAGILGGGLFSLVEDDFARLPSASATLVTNRAFRPLDRQSLADQLRLLEPGGSLVLYKGRLETIAQELEAAGLGGSVASGGVASADSGTSRGNGVRADSGVRAYGGVRAELQASIVPLRRRRQDVERHMLVIQT